MMSVSLGPIALPVGPVVLFGAFATGTLLARRLAGAAAAAASSVAWQAMGVGLAAARLAHLLLHASAYAATPWDIIDLRDGGWEPWIGAASAATWVGWQAWRQVPLRRALAAGTLAMGIAAGGLAALLGVADQPSLPPLAFTDLASGRSTDLEAARRGRPAVVNLWASWCAPCRAEMPLLADAQRRQQAVAVVFVNAGEPADVVRHFLQREGLALDSVLLDPASRLGRAVGSRGLPTTLFIDAEGRPAGSHFGVLSAASLQTRLEALGTTAGR